MSSVDVLLALCKQRKVAVSRVERDLKYGNGYFKSLKKKEIPGNRLSEVADYFGVSMDYLLGATPESYLLGSEHQLMEAEKAYEKENDPDKRNELGGLIDILRDSVADQRLQLTETKIPATENGDGSNGSDDKSELMELYDSFDPSDRARLLAFAQGLRLSRNPHEKVPPKDA